jgi:hypothetical protein
MKIILYIMSACTDPDDASHDRIPFELSSEKIFFGACKKKLRQKLFAEYLSSGANEAEPNEHILIVGMNGITPSQRVRKILWAGRLLSVMTFERAWNSVGNEYPILKRLRVSPLHVKPKYDLVNFIGYTKHGDLHDDEWLTDISAKRNLLVSEDNLFRPHSLRQQYFNRDCCFLLTNEFYARTGGLIIDEHLISILKQAQDRQDITAIAPFGLTASERINGKRGGWLEIVGDQAVAFEAWFNNATNG